MEWLTLEIGTCGLQAGKLREGMKTEKDTIGLGIRQVVARNVSQGGDTVIDVIIVGMVDDVVGHRLGVAKHSLATLKSGQIDIHHFGEIGRAHV